MTKNTDYDNFDRTMVELLRVPHSEIKAKLAAEEENKKNRSGSSNRKRVATPQTKGGQPAV
jgi:hypothetical protein